jgi:uncharacterized protein (DUF1778 family)
MQAKAQHLQIRASAVEKALLAEAAQAAHMNLSQFVLSSSLKAAEEVLADKARFMLSAGAFDEFCRLLEEDPKVLPGLEEQLRNLGG